MKEFNEEKARAGVPVCTRDGRDARIICFDVNSVDGPGFKIIALVRDKDVDADEVGSFTNKGRWMDDGTVSDNDLMMKSATKSGWINLYKEMTHVTKEDAERVASPGCLATIKVKWEEEQ